MSEQNLYGPDAVAKLKEMAEDIDFAMMATALSEKPIHMVPMSTKKVDEQGRIWFLSGKDSQHNSNLQKHRDVHLIYSDSGSMQFLNVYGTVEISTNHARLKELYSSSDDAWFEGVDDPNLTAIGVTPTSAFYWDPKNSRLVTLFKLGVAAATGHQPKMMDQGELNLQ